MTKGEKQVEEYYGNLNNGNGIAEIWLINFVNYSIPSGSVVDTMT